MALDMYGFLGEESLSDSEKNKEGKVFKCFDGRRSEDL